MGLENLDDGSKLEAAWHDALNTSLTYFKAVSYSESPSWKPVSVPSPRSNSAKRSKLRYGLGKASVEDVVVHRRSGKHGDVYRAVVEVDCGSDISVDTFRGCLVTPETRPKWDRMVEEAVTLELLDAHTRVTKTNYRLGWPSSPRDSVTISKTLVDPHTLIDISTSLPRSRHEPAYLRPSPPYVRSQVSLLSWYIQLPSSTGDSPPEGRARISCFWSWNPKGTWAVGSAVQQHLPSLLIDLIDYVREGSSTIPVLLGYGPDVSIGSVAYDPSRITLGVRYNIVDNKTENKETEGLWRQVEFGVSSEESWDVQVAVKTQSGAESSSTIWSSFVGQSPTLSPNIPAPKRLMLRFSHSPLEPGEELVRVDVSIERTTSSTAGVRINGIPITVERMDPVPSSVAIRPLLAETASMTGMSTRTYSHSVERGKEEGKYGKDGAVQKGIAGLVRRNYIYFTSLLQEPEPKWKPVLDSRGVAVHQLDSIDKTLVVYRAEAVFVGVGIWDLFAVIASPGARPVWDKTYEDAMLVEDVNELTDLWHLQSKAAWPVSARDSVMLRTTYKSPSSVHLFGFSVDDTSLFPSIPPSTDPSIIRTQIDLQGWSIESLSPNTTQVTLLEQSDPRGWAGKGSIPMGMMNTLAGMGEFAIKHGGPPVCTRLGGAKTIGSKYDVESETFKFEYAPAKSRHSASSSIATSFPSPLLLSTHVKGDTASDKSSVLSEISAGAGQVECEIRCNADQWSNSFSVVIDPPQKAISALRRHRLSPNGGGLWLTIEHDPKVLRTENGGKVTVTVRRGAQTQGSKPQVMVNGSKVKVDLEDLPENKVQLLKKQKRGKPTRAPLDQPPGLSVRKKTSTDLTMVSAAFAQPLADLTSGSAFAKVAMPFSKWYSFAAETTRSVLVPVATASPYLSIGTTPVEAAVSSLKQVSRIHADRDGESTAPDAWLPVSERDGLKIEKRAVNHVSDTFPVFRAGRIIEGFTAEEVSSAVSNLKSDERFEKPLVLEEYGCGIRTTHVVAHTTFPFKGRSMLVASVVAKMAEPLPPSPSVHGPQTPLSTIFHASTSNFDPTTTNLDPSKYNPTNMPPGSIVLEGWILETIDPYSHEQYAIPSTRCMYLASVDYSCGMPLSVNNMLNSSLPRSLLAVEGLLRSQGPPCRAREPGMLVLAPEEKERSSGKGVWALEGVPERSMGVGEKNEEGEYSLTVTIQPSVKHASREGNSGQSPALRHADSKLSVNTGRSTVIDLGEEIRKGKKDLVVMEVEIGSEGVKKGCELALSAVSLLVALHSTSQSDNYDGTVTPTSAPTTSSGILPLTLPFNQLALPFVPSIISLEPSVLQTASLDPSSPSRHLLRVTLPTSGYDTLIDDPLTGPKAMLPRPRWLLDLINDGAVVQLKLRASKPSATASPALEETVADEGSKATYTYRGEEIAVQDEKRAKHLGLRDGTRQNLPQLIFRAAGGAEGEEVEGKGGKLFKSLDRPLAVRQDYLREQSKVMVEEKPGEAGVVEGSEVDQTVDIQPIQSPVARPPLIEQPRYAYNFWRYPRLPFAGSVPSTAMESPTKPRYSPPLDSALTAAAEKENSTQKQGESSSTAMVLHPAQPVQAGTSQLLRPVMSLPGVIIACVLSFLLGSLLRSILSEADFVIYQPGSLAGVTTHDIGTGASHWRELKRLAEWRLGWDWDLILAIARRN